MQYWLLKTEPSVYSYADLQREKQTVWDGVNNNLALRFLRSMKKGDRAFIYHTGKEKALIGVVEVVSSPYADPEGEDPKIVVVDVKAREKLGRAVPLSEVKADPAFSDFQLVRLPRLSVMPVSQAQWERLLSMGEK